MKLRYIGPYTSVRVPSTALTRAPIEVAHGETADFDDDHGRALLDQPDNWELADEPKPAKKASAKPPTD
jgi:hypothetical protein